MEETTSLVPSDFRLTVDQLIAAWLHSLKVSGSDSEETAYTYGRYIQQFRAVLQHGGMDYDSEPRLIAMLAQGWAANHTKKDKVSAATIGQRLATISSFYEYAILSGYMEKNPIKQIKRPKVNTRDYAKPLEQDFVQERLAAIDRSTLPGLRDYAILSVALTTGRRSKELVSLRLGDIHIAGDSILIVWQRCKGGKYMEDILSSTTAKALLAYLQRQYCDFSGLPYDTPVWLSYARNKSNGGAISKQTLSDICKKRLGTSKVHSTRHSTAVHMEDAGAKLTEIANQLGHSNVAITSEYLKRFHSAENPFADELARRFGIS